MSAPLRQLEAAQWESPWFDSVRAAWCDLRTRLAQGVDLHTALAALAPARVNACGLPLRFVAQQELPEGQAYEAFIYQHGAVPTRENLHDIFNALIWAAFPLAKRELNRQQAQQIAAAGVGAVRGRVRDRATLFDENAGLLCLRRDAQGEQLFQALRAHDWARLFAPGALAQARLLLFGHALLEKMMQPYKAITAHCYVLWFAPQQIWPQQDAPLHALLDQHLAHALEQGALQQEPVFCPLPLAGVPGWWPQQDAAFYADQSVFRPPRRSQPLY
ncbi:DUF3025 domain-containing protein [Massilia sp. W12]|uniref:DUF3025 domain-containing protein n=1 Tax=Massilia sp. W12 TaxID=3126507 RepID=UPI0030D15956